MDVAVKLGLRIVELRSARGLTQAQLAKAAEIAPNTLSRVERGELGVSLTVLAAIAGGLNVSIARLVDFDGELGTPDDVVEGVLDKLPDDPAVLRARLREALRRLVAAE